MSSTPIPSIKIGKAWWAMVCSNPNTEQMPKPAATEMTMQIMPTKEMVIRQ